MIRARNYFTLHIACKKGPIDLVDGLLGQINDRQAAIRANDYAVLFTACSGGIHPVVKYLFNQLNEEERQAAICAKGYALLTQAGLAGDLALVKYLLNQVKEENHPEAIRIGLWPTLSDAYKRGNQVLLGGVFDYSIECFEYAERRMARRYVDYKLACLAQDNYQLGNDATLDVKRCMIMLRNLVRRGATAKGESLQFLLKNIQNLIGIKEIHEQCVEKDNALLKLAQAGGNEAVCEQLWWAIPSVRDKAIGDGYYPSGEENAVNLESMDKAQSTKASAVNGALLSADRQMPEAIATFVANYIGLFQSQKNGKQEALVRISQTSALS